LKKVFFYIYIAGTWKKDFSKQKKRKKYQTKHFQNIR